MKFLKFANLSYKQLLTPSPMNPRLKGLSVEEPSVKSLAESIKKHGQLQPIIVTPVNGKFEVLDGDRRCVAVFKVLKLKTIKAAVYETTPLERAKVRLVSNIQREDLSPVEKGKYCTDLFKVLAETENLDPDKAWLDRATRSKLLSQISLEVGVKPVTIINWVQLWQTYPPDIQRMIAANKEELRKGLVPPSKALVVAHIARTIKANPAALLKIVIKHNFSTKKLEELRRAILKEGLEVNQHNFEEVMLKFSKKLTHHGQLMFRTELYKKALQKAAEFNMRFTDYVNLSLEFSLNHHDMFKQFVIQKIGSEESVME